MKTLKTLNWIMILGTMLHALCPTLLAQNSDQGFLIFVKEDPDSYFLKTDPAGDLQFQTLNLNSSIEIIGTIPGLDQKNLLYGTDQNGCFYLAEFDESGNVNDIAVDAPELCGSKPIQVKAVDRRIGNSGPGRRINAGAFLSGS